MQLRMNYDVDTYISEDNKVRPVCNIVEEMKLDSMLGTYSILGRKPVVNPVTMLRILLFCYSEGIFSCRKIEDFCTYDTRAHFLLKGEKAPDHTTINRFRKALEEFTPDLLTQFSEILIEQGHVDLKSIYIDGTKIEAVAGRYTFVWRKSRECFGIKNKKGIGLLSIPKNKSNQNI